MATGFSRFGRPLRPSLRAMEAQKDDLQPLRTAQYQEDPRNTRPVTTFADNLRPRPAESSDIGRPKPSKTPSVSSQSSREIMLRQLLQKTELEYERKKPY